MTGLWHVLQNAPRDRAVWLFLPSATFKAAADGTVSNVRHACVVGKWDAARGAWISRDSNHEVYPSLWCDADVAGAPPDHPLLAT